MVKVFTTNSDGKIEFTKDELKKLLNEVWQDGYDSNRHYWLESPTITNRHYWCTSPTITTGTPFNNDFNITTAT